ncbi:transposase [Streptomyces sp. NPDC101149]|uniref:transposase n=1 Tax=Streptomyces sp. NPDC101149 TaxID=3366113 RepID=UPI003822F0DF
MDSQEVNRVRAKLALYVADVFASVPRKDQRAKGDCYLWGLMLEGRRKPIQAMAARLPDGNEQNLQQLGAEVCSRRLSADAVRDELPQEPVHRLMNTVRMGKPKGAEPFAALRCG